MPRERSAGVLALTLIVGVLAATVLSVLLRQFIAPSSVVNQVLLKGFTYEVGPFLLSLVMARFSFGFTIDINLLTILGLLAAYYYWKYRT